MTTTTLDHETSAASAISAELEALQQKLAPFYHRLAHHPLYRSFTSIEHVRTFMQSHVFAVWDFMSLLKSLQRGLTCIEVPWLPTADPATRRFVNEIVLGEESDVYEGRPVSHFELYREAMHACGASSAAIDDVVARIAAGTPIAKALSDAPPAAAAFARTTFAFIETGKLHIIASAFTFGREDLIPDLFRGFLRDQDERLNGQLSLFRWYLDRHIEVDGDEHGPLSLKMIQNLCGEDQQKWSEATHAAIAAVEARLLFWDAITATLTP